VLRAQHTPHGVQAVGLRQKALLQRFLVATTAQQSFSVARQYPRPFAFICG
jgi:hypothetical protein